MQPRMGRRRMVGHTRFIFPTGGLSSFRGSQLARLMDRISRVLCTKGAMMRRAFASCSSRQGRVRVLVYAATAVLLWALGSTHAQISPPVDPALPPAFKEAAAKPTPRTPDGHPDLTGYWTTGATGDHIFGAVQSGSAAPLGQAQVDDDGKSLDLGIENERDICIQNVKDAKKRWGDP